MSHLKNTFTEISRLVFDPTAGHHSLVNKDERDGVGRDDLGVWVNIYTIYKRDNQDRPTV